MWVDIDLFQNIYIRKDIVGENKMNKWIKIAQHEDLDKKHREYLKALESENSNSYNMRLELAEESLKRANSVLSGTKNINAMKVSFVDLPVQHNTTKPITYSKL